MNKRGDVGDFLMLVIVIFVVALTIFLGATVWDKMKPHLENLDTGDNDSAATEALNSSLIKIDRTYNILDPLFAIFFFGFYLTLLISIFYLDTHPGFMVFGIIMFIVVLLVGMVTSDVFQSIGQTETLSNQTAAYPITYFLMSNSPVIILVMGFIFFIILYASRRTG